MTNLEILEKWGDAQVSADWETFNALSTEDFSLIGPGPEPLNREGFLTWLKSIHDANAYYKHNIKVVEASGDIIKTTVQVEGKHIGDWDLNFMGVGIIPATNIAWKNPQEDMIVTIRDGKVAKLEVTVPEDGGIPGILAQLGVK